MPTRSFLQPLTMFAAALALLAAGGCNRGGDLEGTGVQVSRTVQRGVTPGSRALVFDNYDGNVTLRDTTGPEAELAFEKHARAGSRDEAQRLLSRIRIEERGGDQEFAYQMASGAMQRTSVDVRGRVPQDVSLRVHAQSGNIALSGLRGPLDVNGENGNIRIGGAGRDVHAETRNGSIEVGLRGLPAQGGEVRLRTANGDVELTLPASVSADVEARTEAGTIDLGDLPFSDADRNRSGAGARFDGQLGEGNAKVRLRTENGSIRLRRGTVRRLPDVDRAALGQDTTRADTTARDSLLGPGVPIDTTQADTSGLLGPPAGGAQQQRGGQQSSPSDTASPPPFLQRPNGSTGSNRDTSRNAPVGGVPGLPSLQRDTTTVGGTPR